MENVFSISKSNSTFNENITIVKIDTKDGFCFMVTASIRIRVNGRYVDIAGTSETLLQEKLKEFISSIYKIHILEKYHSYSFEDNKIKSIELSIGDPFSIIFERDEYDHAKAKNLKIDDIIFEQITLNDIKEKIQELSNLVNNTPDEI